MDVLVELPLGAASLAQVHKAIRKSDGKELVLKITGHERLLDGDPPLQLSVELRNRTIVPLGFLQVALLRRLRNQNRQPPMNESDLADTRTYSRGELLRGALLTINGIAAGLRNTG